MSGMMTKKRAQFHTGEEEDGVGLKEETGEDFDAALAAVVDATQSKPVVTGGSSGAVLSSPAKRTKGGEAREVVLETNDNGEKFIALSGKRRATISSFKGNKFLDVREYYEKDGKMLPGKKGITLPLEQLEQLFAAKDMLLPLLK